MNRPPGPLLERLAACDPDVCDAAELDALTAALAEVRSWCDAYQVRVTRRQRALAAEGRSAEPASSIARHGRSSGKEARAAADRERVCSSMPGFEDALASGAIAAGHVDAVAAASSRLDDEALADFTSCATDLLSDAERLGVDAFARTARDVARHIAAQRRPQSDADELERQRAAVKVTRWTDPSTGMCHTRLELDPLSDQQFWTAVQHQRAQLRRKAGRSESWDRLTVDAVVAAVATGSTDGRRRVPSLSVLIDLDTLNAGRHERSVCETEHGTALPVSTVRRMACEADLIPVVLDGAGRALDVGRSRRLATPDQRAALAAMHRTCVYPECGTGFDDCRIHHVTPWSAGGNTDLDDLAPVCERHHHLVHEGGWSLAMSADRVVTWARPDGEIHWSGTTLDRRPELVTA